MKQPRSALALASVGLVLVTHRLGIAGYVHWQRALASDGTFDLLEK